MDKPVGWIPSDNLAYFIMTVAIQGMPYTWDTIYAFIHILVTFLPLAISCEPMI